MKQKMRAWIIKYPIAAFFLFAIALCFAALFPVALFIPQTSTLTQLLSFYLAKIGVYSPVLAGMFVSRTIQPQRQRISLGRRLLIFLPVWLMAEIILIADLKQTASPGASIIALAIFSLPVALLPAFVITSAYSGSAGVKHMLSTLIKPGGTFFFYLVALLTFPIIHIAGTGITNLSHSALWLHQFTKLPDLGYTLLITFCSVLLFSGGINEESGWRGFTQKRLQAKVSPLVANLFLWLLMVIWHIPNDLMQYQNGGYLQMRFLLYPFITILFGWVFNRTKGSIWAAAIFHASMNTMNPLMELFPVTAAGNILLIGFAVAVVIIDRMWRKLPGDHPAVFQEPFAPVENTSST